MPSVDLAGYIDLTLHDVDHQDLVDAVIVDLASRLPDLTLREGNTEAVLIESTALLVDELVFAINRLPGALAEGLFRLYGIDRFLGAAPTVDLRFVLSDTLGHELPPGTRVRLDLGGAEPVVFTTTLGLVIPAGSDTGTVAATGDRLTAEANGTLAGTTVELLDAVPYVERVELATAVAGGVDPETDDVYRDRAVARLGRLNDALVTPDHFVAAALERPEVSRALALNNTRDGGTVGASPGYITVAVYGTGAPVTATVKAELDADLEARALANLSVAVVDPTLTAVAVTTNVVRAAGYTDEQVKANVDAALRAYLNPTTWPWTGTVYRNELISVIDRAEGVARVDTLTAPAGDTALAGVAPLATAGTLTITTTA